MSTGNTVMPLPLARSAVSLREDAAHRVCSLHQIRLGSIFTSLPVPKVGVGAVLRQEWG